MPDDIKCPMCTEKILSRNFDFVDSDNCEWCKTLRENENYRKRIKRLSAGLLQARKMCGDFGYSDYFRDNILVAMHKAEPFEGNFIDDVINRLTIGEVFAKIRADEGFEPDNCTSV